MYNSQITEILVKPVQKTFSHVFISTFESLFDSILILPSLSHENYPVILFNFHHIRSYVCHVKEMRKILQLSD